MDSATFIKDMIIEAWTNKVKQATKLFASLTGGPIHRELIAGGNKVIYVMGHLTVASDKLFDVLNIGERLYPELDEFFFIAQDREHEYPHFELLKQEWETVNQELANRFESLTLIEWLQSPSSLSEDNLDPANNRLNILISRTGHLAYHLGQLALTKHMPHEGHAGKVLTDCDYI